MPSFSFETAGARPVRSFRPPPRRAPLPQVATEDVASSGSRVSHVAHDDALASLLQRSVRQRATRAAGRLLQRQPNVTAEFIGKTPEEDDLIETVGNTLLSNAFEVEAQFKPAREGTAEEQKQMVNSGQYRQYVRGYFVGTDADDEPHKLVGENPGPLDLVEWREDVLPSAQRKRATKRYGYRSGWVEAPQGYFLDRERTTPDRDLGPYFWCWDAPQGTPSDLAMKLEFEGRLVDTKDNSMILATRHWTVAGSKDAT